MSTDTDTATATTKPKSRARRGVPAPETGATSSAAIDTLTGGDAPRIVFIPVDRTHPHPRNPRKDVGDVDELAADIAANGVDQPATVVPHPDIDGDFLMVIGHRRRAATIQAGVTVLPAVIREDLTPALQHKMMVRENIHRSDLTVVEEADAYQGMLDVDGLTVDEIASGVSRSATTVRERLKVAKLPEPARAALHTHTATLADAQALDDFDDDPAVRDALASALGTPDYRYKVTQARTRREVTEKFRALLDALAAANIPAAPDARVPEDGMVAGQARGYDIAKPADGRRSGYGLSSDDAIEIVRQAGPGWSYRFTPDYGGELYLYRPLTLEEAAAREARAAAAAAAEPVDEEAAARQREQAAAEAQARSEEAAARAELVEVSATTRRTFLEHLVHDRKLTRAETEAISGYAGTVLLIAGYEDDHDWVLPFDTEASLPWLRVDADAVVAKANEDEVDAWPLLYTAARTAADKLGPGNRLLAALAAAVEPLHWNPTAYGRDLTTRWYGLLQQLGYHPAEAESTALAAMRPDEPLEVA